MEDDEYSDFPIIVKVFKRKTLTNDVEMFSRDMLEHLLEDLDEENSDPDGDGTTATEKMKKAALELAKAINEDYEVFWCEPTDEVIEYSKEESKEIIKEGS